VHQLADAFAGPLKRVGVFSVEQVTTFKFFFFDLDSGENIVNFVLLSRVLPMQRYRSCSLHQFGKVVVDGTGLFSDSSASIIVLAIVKDIIS